ncbi:HlyD family efflux transporter periplasmic adaptor subunit [Proteiniclasticum sp. C24MP]|uniref:HlyD family efflux transporter periplasmic adaptor subunit n=1 Tax=Proteiniclasticum sp. C24MP TaxID=3374101 RepID=UPI003754B2A7
MDKNRKKNKKNKKWIAALVGTAVVLFVGSRIIAPKPVAYEAVEAKTEDIITWYSFAGNIEANSREVLLSDSPFTVGEIYVEVGDLVEEGTELLESGSEENPKSGIEGEITEVFVKENESVSPGTKLVSIVDYSALEVVVKVDEFELDAVTEGKEVVVRVNALNKDYKGTVESLSKEGTVMNGVTYFMAVVQLDYDDALKVGMSTEVTLLKEEVKGAVTLPMTAIKFHDDNTPYVLKMGPEGTTVKRHEENLSH